MRVSSLFCGVALAVNLVLLLVLVPASITLRVGDPVFRTNEVAEFGLHRSYPSFSMVLDKEGKELTPTVFVIDQKYDIVIWSGESQIRQLVEFRWIQRARVKSEQRLKATDVNSFTIHRPSLVPFLAGSGILLLIGGVLGWRRRPAGITAALVGTIVVFHWVGRFALAGTPSAFVGFTGAGVLLAFVFGICLGREFRQRCEIELVPASETTNDP